MSRKAEKVRKKQTGQALRISPLARIGQAMLPMVAGIAATKKGLMSWVHEKGLEALEELLIEDAESIAGKKGKHRANRTHNHWGSAVGELSFGGRKLQVKRPRVRTKTGQEVNLPSIEEFRQADPLPARVVHQILLGVSTRGYESSLEPMAPELTCRGSSKSAASRHLVALTRKKAEEYLNRRLDDVELLALMLDGLEVAGHTVVVALGIAVDGKKVPLGLWLGSTENAAICTSLLQNLLERGLRIEGRVLCVVDGGKGIRKALSDVLGDLAVIQRCQLHKRRNLESHLPQSRRSYVVTTMIQAYQSKSAELARKRLRALASWLERAGYEQAAGSLREGMEETLTVLKLGLPSSLQKSLATTNAIENLMGSIRRVSRNVKRWRSGDMTTRWTALGIVTAEKKFRRIKGYRNMDTLLHVLRSKELSFDNAHEAA